MKKVINISLGGRSFTLNEDAYSRLNQFLDHFRTHLTVPEGQQAEVMDEIEGRIAELFFQEVGDSNRVVTKELVDKVAATLGMPDGAAESGAYATQQDPLPRPRKLYRDPDEKVVAGVCSGLGHYLDIDLTVLRILFLVAFILGSAGFWIYVILWIAVPKADTPAKKCEMYQMPATAENMSRFAREYKK
jgi:phage shock protein PspC (stress-responsive transcriptional regulator)